MEDENTPNVLLLEGKRATKKVPKHKRDPRIKELIKCMLGGMSLMEAGLAAGFSEKHMRSQVYKPTAAGESVADYIKQQVARRSTNARERAAVHTDSIVGSLVEIMQASPADVLPDHPVLQKAKANGVDHLIKKIVITPIRVSTRSRKNANGTVTTSPVIREKIDLEMYSRLDAIQQLRDTYGMKQEPRHNNLEETRRQEVEREIANIMADKNCDQETAAKMLLEHLGDAPHLTAEIQKILKRISKAKNEDGVH